jgi:hypothetical protein
VVDPDSVMVPDSCTTVEVAVLEVVEVFVLQALRIKGRINTKDIIPTSHFLLNLLNNVISYLFHLCTNALPLHFPGNLRPDALHVKLQEHLRCNVELPLLWRGWSQVEYCGHHRL